MFPELKSLGTREKLLVSALQLISEGGAERFSASALIQRAGMSKGALYHHFESLEQLLLEAVNYRLDERLMQTERRFLEYADAATWLYAYFEEMTAFSSSPAFVNIVLYFNQRGLAHDDIRKHVCRNNEAYLQRMMQYLQHFYPAHIENARLETIASMILFTVEGVSAHGVLQKDSTRFKGTWEWLIQVIIRDLAAYEKANV